jgi:hypothetical protein
MSELVVTSGLLEDGKARLRLEGAFGEEKHARTLIDFLEGQLKGGVAQMEQAFAAQPGIPPGARRILEVLKAVRFAAEGKRGIVRLETEPLRLEDLSLMLGGFSLHRAGRVGE